MTNEAIIAATNLAFKHKDAEWIQSVGVTKDSAGEWLIMYATRRPRPSEEAPISYWFEGFPVRIEVIGKVRPACD